MELSPTLLIVLVIVFYAFSSIQILAEYERGVIFRLGKLLPQPKGPGVILVLRPIDRIVRLSLRTVVLDVPPQPRAYRVAPVGLRVSDDTRPFGADVVIANVQLPTRLCLWVYLETDAEGQPKQVVQIPVTIVP